MEDGLNTQGSNAADTAAVAPSVSVSTKSDVKQVAIPSPAAKSPDVKASVTAPSADAKTPGVKQPETIADRIDKFLEGKKKADPASPEQDAKVKSPDDPAAEPTDNEDSAPQNIKDDPIFKKVLSERKQARMETKKALKELETFRADAGQYRNIDGFLKKSGISGQDAAQALKITDLIYNNPQEAHKHLSEMVQRLGQQLGLQLPPDLQKEVESGYISEERARELSVAKSREQQLAAQNERTTGQIQQMNQQADTERAMTQRQGLVDSWISQVEKTDPDLGKKLDMIAGEMHKIVAREGDPQSAEQMYERLGRAHKAVNDQIRSFQPQRQAVQPSPASVGVSHTATAAPKTYEEAMAVALNRFGARR